MFHFHYFYGDIIGGETDSFWWQLVIATLATIPAVIAVFLGYWLEKRHKSNKEKEIQNLQLFNFNEHIKKIAKHAAQIPGIFKEFSDKTKEKPLDDISIAQHVFIPDLNRVLEMDKEKIFAAFIRNYDNRIEAAVDYRKSYNSLEYLKHIVGEVYSKYDKLNEEIYYNKLKIIEATALVESQISRLTMSIKKQYPSQYKEDKLYAVINNFTREYFNKVGNENKSLSFHKTEFLIALRDALLPFSDNESVCDILSNIKANLNLVGNIKSDSIALSELTGENVEAITICITELNKVSTILEPKIEKVLKH